MDYFTALESKIQTLAEATNTVRQWKDAREKIVFTNGCFDILHKGHVLYLSQARNLGTKLIVGINSDESVQRLKGENRPVKELESRMLVLAAFACVDMVVAFATDTPLELITHLQPHVLVKGSDYAIADIVGAKEVMLTGGEVKTIDFVSGFSSSNYIKKL